ncbi:MAG: IS110 family transposase [Anaerolineae bacterium]|nr:IS110 family transposase [Anaerolineae bacterium]
MHQEVASPGRYIGLDVHKHYLVAAGVDGDQNEVLSPRQVPLSKLARWVEQQLSQQDALVLEMSTNSFQLYDDLVEHVHSVTLVHPPHVALITQAPVKVDRQAALKLAKLHAARLLPAVWVPNPEQRDVRALVAQRAKMVRLATQAKNRLHALLHRRRLSLPEEGGLFAPENRSWWLALPLSALEKVHLQSDLNTLDFAQAQIALLEEGFKAVAAQDERMPLLVQLPGISLIAGLTLLAAIGDITRFPSAKHLVGYAGLGSRVHDSGQTRRTGRITKQGRRDLRATMVEAAHTAVQIHPHWKAELARLEPRLGKPKAMVAIARKLLVAVWHILTKQTADRFADPAQVARFFLQYAYRLGRAYRPRGQSPAVFVRRQLDRLGIGAELTCTYHGKRPVPLPPSSLTRHL